jgi:hypothetical protein
LSVSVITDPHDVAIVYVFAADPKMCVGADHGKAGLPSGGGGKRGITA